MGNEVRVVDLIENGNSWNMTWLQKYFLPPDIHSIMKIKLPSQSCNDRVIWHYDRCGEYTVKSGYHVARTWKNLDNVASSSISSRQWATIWKLIVPCKVKIFLWRALSRLLSSMENLELKMVVADSRCRICGEAGESILHALFVCQHAHDVWELTSFTVSEFFNRVACLWDVWDIVYSKVAFNEIQLFGLIMWGIWRARNRILYDGAKPSPNCVVASAQRIWDSCVRRNCRNINTMCIVQDVVIWEPPQLGWFKLNTEVAVDVQNGKVSYGAGIRNHEGLVMLAETNFGNYCEDVAIAEAEAINFGIQLAKETGLFP